MNHLDTARAIGAQHAQRDFEKGAAGGLLARAGQAWRSMTPAGKSLAGHMGGGALLGGGAGAASGDDYSLARTLGGAAMGGLAGAGAYGLRGALAQRGAQQGGKLLGPGSYQSGARVAPRQLIEGTLGA